MKRLLGLGRETLIQVIAGVVCSHLLADVQSPFRILGAGAKLAQLLQRGGNVSDHFLDGLVEFIDVVRRFVNMDNGLVAGGILLGGSVFHNVVTNGNDKVSLVHDVVLAILLGNTDAPHRIRVIARDDALGHHGAHHRNLRR